MVTGSPIARALRVATTTAASMYAVPTTCATRPTHAIGLRGSVCSMIAARPIAMITRPMLYQYENESAPWPRSRISRAAENMNISAADASTPYRSTVPPAPGTKKRGIRSCPVASATSATTEKAATVTRPSRIGEPDARACGRGSANAPTRWQAAAVQASRLWAVTAALMSRGARAAATRPAKAQTMAPPLSQSSPGSPRAR